MLALQGGMPPGGERRDLLARLPAPATAHGHGAEDDPLAIHRTYGAELTLHPFFGYTFRPAAHGANNDRPVPERGLDVLAGAIAERVLASGRLPELARHRPRG